MSSLQGLGRALLWRPSSSFPPGTSHTQSTVEKPMQSVQAPGSSSQYPVFEDTASSEPSWQIDYSKIDWNVKPENKTIWVPPTSTTSEDVEFDPIAFGKETSRKQSFEDTHAKMEKERKERIAQEENLKKMNYMGVIAVASLAKKIVDETKQKSKTKQTKQKSNKSQQIIQCFDNVLSKYQKGAYEDTLRKFIDNNASEIQKHDGLYDYLNSLL